MSKKDISDNFIYIVVFVIIIIAAICYKDSISGELKQLLIIAALIFITLTKPGNEIIRSTKKSLNKLCKKALEDSDSESDSSSDEESHHKHREPMESAPATTAVQEEMPEMEIINPKERCAFPKGCEQGSRFCKSGLLVDQETQFNTGPKYIYNRDAFPWGNNAGYTDCYKPTPRELNESNLGGYRGIDERNAYIGAARARDKKCMDGAVTKNMNYYKKNYGRELDEYESKLWWGNDEY